MIVSVIWLVSYDDLLNLLNPEFWELEHFWIPWHPVYKRFAGKKGFTYSIVTVIVTIYTFRSISLPGTPTQLEGFSKCVQPYNRDYF